MDTLARLNSEPAVEGKEGSRPRRDRERSATGLDRRVVFMATQPSRCAQAISGADRTLVFRCCSTSRNTPAHVFCAMMVSTIRGDDRFAGPIRGRHPADTVVHDHAVLSAGVSTQPIKGSEAKHAYASESVDFDRLPDLLIFMGPVRALRS